MANRQNGEVSIEIGEKTYTMALTINSMVALEEMFSTPTSMMTFPEISALAERGSMKHLRAFLWAVLQEHHPEIEVQQVGALVSEAGGLGVFTLKLQELVLAATPDPRDVAQLGGKAPAKNPPNAQAAKGGTGGRSTSKLVAHA